MPSNMHKIRVRAHELCPTDMSAVSIGLQMHQLMFRGVERIISFCCVVVEATTRTVSLTSQRICGNVRKTGGGEFEHKGKRQSKGSTMSAAAGAGWCSGCFRSSTERQ